MAKYVLRNAGVAFDGVDVSTLIREVAVECAAAEVSFTAMGAGGEQRSAGIRDDKFTFTAYSDFAPAKLHATIASKFVAAGTIEVKVTPSQSGTVGEANPLFVGYVPLLTYSPVSGAVGDAAMTPLEMPVSGTITFATVGTLP